MLSALYVYGPPRRVSMLAAMLADKAREREESKFRMKMFRYMTDMNYMIFRALSGEAGSSVPDFDEAINQRPVDEWSATDIINDVLQWAKS